jgi:hypothetical protein
MEVPQKKRYPRLTVVLPAECFMQIGYSQSRTDRSMSVTLLKSGGQAVFAHLPRLIPGASLPLSCHEVEAAE